VLKTASRIVLFN